MALLRWLICEPRDTIDCVVSWRPTWGRHGIEWPTYRGRVAGRWCSASPVWDRARARDIARRLKDLLTR